MVLKFELYGGPKVSFVKSVLCLVCLLSTCCTAAYKRGGGGFPCGIRVDIPCECLSNSLSFRVVVAVEHHLIHC